MKRISPEKEIQYISRVIEKNITYYQTLNDKGFLSENILSQLRNLVEDVAILINNKENRLDLDTHYENIEPSLSFIKKKSRYKFIIEFHEFLKGTASHYTPSEDGAEKLVSFYFRYICLIKTFLKDTYNIDVIKNIEDFPIYDDKSMKENYDKICKVVEEVDNKPNFIKGKFYVQKINTIYSKGKIYYEVTLTKATDYVNKFERITMFSIVYIPDNYSVNLSCVDKEVQLSVGKTKIKVINDYKVAIRVCELKNLFKSVGIDKKFDDEYKEYRNLMEYLRKNNCTITDILLLPQEEFRQEISTLSTKAENHVITEAFKKIRKHILDELPGHNILRYLTTKMENLVIRDQLDVRCNFVFQEACFKPGCGMFDSMPYAMSFLKHNVSWFHLVRVVDMADKEYQLLYRRIQHNAENEKILYTPISDLEEFDNLPELVEKYNRKYLSIKRNGENTLIIQNGYIYIKSYENKSMNIIQRLEEYLDMDDNELRDVIDVYTSFYLDASDISLDKINVLDTIFKESGISLIYGSAGTGKTKILELLAEAFENYDKYFISTTNAAVSNLSSRIHAKNSEFKTVSEFKGSDSYCEILFIDECSMISNEDIIAILSRQKYKAIIMVGDICQIESIKYSNWFQLCNRYFGEGIKYELTYIHRTEDPDLLDLWDCVRKDDRRAINILSNQEYTQPLSEEIFHYEIENEIVLCLNYDGMYGINNINKIRQGANPNKEFTFGVDTYKIGDRILFNDCPRFNDFLFNNLKGTIKDISIDAENKCWWFTIEIDEDSVDLEYCPLDVATLDSEVEGKINVRFKVNEFADKEDDENEYGHIIPFNLAYAISIHKAQGLEFESVKIVITSNIEDRISKNIFYTAITRAKNNLKVYWNSDSQTRIFDSFQKRNSNKDIAIIRQKLKQ